MCEELALWYMIRIMQEAYERNLIRGKWTAFFHAVTAQMAIILRQNNPQLKCVDIPGLIYAFFTFLSMIHMLALPVHARRAIYKLSCSSGKILRITWVV